LLYIYLSHSNRQVILPTAISVGPTAESDPVVTFVDAQGEAVAVFLRADVAVYSAHNLGPTLPEQASEHRIDRPKECSP
jgi:hypothetical protein